MRLSRGIVDAEMPKLFLDPVKIEETLGSDTVYKRELYLASENNLYIKGLAYSSHSRVKILKNAFGGLRNHIVYEVDTLLVRERRPDQGKLHACNKQRRTGGSFSFSCGNDRVCPCPVHIKVYG